MFEPILDPLYTFPAKIGHHGFVNECRRRPDFNYIKRKPMATSGNLSVAGTIN